MWCMYLLLAVAALPLGTLALCRVANLKDPNGILLPQGKFQRYACAQCYKFSPGVFFRPEARWQVLEHVDNDGHPIKVFHLGNRTEVESDSEELAKSFLEDGPGPSKWKACCSSAFACCSEQMSQNRSTEDGWCPRLWDGWQCWADAAPGTEQRRPCPGYITTGTTPTANCSQFASRRCDRHGSWHLRSTYTTCTRHEAERLHSYVLLAAYGVSMVLLVPAIAIFCLYRQLEGHRIILHRNFFSSLLLNAVAETVFRHQVVLPELSAGSSVAAENSPGCRLLLAATKYLRCSTYLWMFCEGYHLHHLISASFASEGNLTLFYLIGWGIPVLPTAVYVTLRLLYYDGKCWMQPHPQYEWVMLAPNLLSLLVNVILLIDITRIMVSMLQSTPHREPVDYRKAVRATIVLVPLFGVHLLFTLYRPDPRYCIWREVYLYADHLLDGLQGAIVALNFCFLNGEVHTAMRRSYRTLVDKYHPGLRRSHGSHSFSIGQTSL